MPPGPAAVPCQREETAIALELRRRDGGGTGAGERRSSGPDRRLSPDAVVPFAARLVGDLRRRPARLVLACVATALGPVVVAQAGGTASGSPPPAVAAPGVAHVDFPLPGNAASWQGPAVAAAATCPGLPADVLVAIAQVESRLGLRPGPSTAGARGPMQFLPATWAAYGADGDGDGRADVMNAVDALHGAARFLCANGGGDADRLPSALWNYNHSPSYVGEVLGLAWLNRAFRG